MNRLRKVIFWCHLPVGVVAGIIILIMSVTGVLLAYERQITAWADTRGYKVAPSSADAAHLPVEAILDKAGEKSNAAPTTVTLRSDRDAPASVGLSGNRTLFVDPYTGEVLGEGSQTVRSFFRTVTDWHRWLGAQGDNRAIAKAITGACNLGFLFLVMSGFYLWWPRKWVWLLIRNVFWFKRGLGGKARDFNWHNVIGLWCVSPLFIVVLAGVVISYSWAGNLVYRVVGEVPPAPRAAGPPTGEASPQRAGASVRERRGPEAGQGGERERSGGEASRESAAPAEIRDGLDELWARAEQQAAGWRSITMRLPASAEAPVVFTIDQGNGGQPQQRAQLTLDRKTGEVAQWEPFSNLTTGRRLRSLLRFAHTGEVLGIAGQTIAGIASAGGAVLVWTGLALAWRRFRAWVTRGKRGVIPAVSPAAGIVAANSSDLSSEIVSPAADAGD